MREIRSRRHGSFGPPSKGDLRYRGLALTTSPIGARFRLGLVKGTLGVENSLEHRRKEHQIDELRIELRSAAGRDHIRGIAGATTFAISTAMRDGIEGVGERDDPRRQRYALAAQPPRISGAVPALVMRDHTFRELGIERGERSEYLGAALGMRGDCLTLGGREIGVLVNDVEQRLVDLADVVKERDALDVLFLVIIEMRGVGEDEGVGGDTTNVGASFGVVCVDRVEEDFQARRGDAFARLAPAVLPDEVSASEDAGGESGDRTHDGAMGKFHTLDAVPRSPETTNALTRSVRALSHVKPAVAYSPALSRAEYHRRCRA